MFEIVFEFNESKKIKHPKILKVKFRKFRNKSTENFGKLSTHHENAIKSESVTSVKHFVPILVDPKNSVTL